MNRMVTARGKNERARLKNAREERDVASYVKQNVKQK